MSWFSRKNKKQIEVAENIQKTLTPEENDAVAELAKDAVFNLQEEFKGWLQSVHNMGEQSLTVEEQRKQMSERLNGLSESVYIAYFPQIVSIVQKSKEKCQAFMDSDEQVSNILSWLPRLKDHEELLLLYIQERRKKYGLVV